MKQTSTSRKNNQIARDKIAMIIMTEISDPRLDMITVTDAEVSRDRSVCNVYISADADRYDDVFAGLESARGRIRSLLGKSLKWRVTPELRFMIDDTIDVAEKIEKALLNVPETMNIPKDEFGYAIDLDDNEGDSDANANVSANANASANKSVNACTYTTASPSADDLEEGK